MTKLVIDPPSTEPKETPPEEENGKIKHDGFGLIQAIYDFIVPRDLICYVLVKKYKKIIDLTKWWNRVFFSILVFMCVVVDYFFSISIDVIILTIFLTVCASFVRGLGMIEWIMTFVHP